MCGIAGILSASPGSVTVRHLKKMTDSIAHRGPDGEGFWHNKNERVFLGHRRLAILDLSDNAAQPLHYQQRYTIVYNGEIYNYTEIRDQLQTKGYRFTSTGDTEVITAAYDLWKEKCLQQFDGMFAFAIWDEKEQQLFAARDRFGEKPFYFYEDGGHFIFASEMKALWSVGVEKKVDDKMLLNYLALGHVQNSTDHAQTFYQDIYALPPAHYLKLNAGTFTSTVHRYWRINKETKINITAPDAIDKFTALFNTSVKRRLRSNVTIGTSLSGGLDSSSIIATIKNLRGSKSSLKTFSAVFPGYEKDESKYIELVSDTFMIRNFKTTATAAELVSDIEKLCWHQEEPFQTSSIYAQYKVYELARQKNVTVLLDGQGGDETLAGYTKYIHWYLQEILSRHKIGSMRKQKKALLHNEQPFSWGIKNHFAAFLPLHAAILLEKQEYRKTIHHPDISPDFLEIVKGRDWEGIHKPIVTKLNDILHFNVSELGLEELLRFADRNSMAHGCEVRLPFLSHELVEFIFSLPANFKINNGWTKWLLRNAMQHKLPAEIVWRKNKVGFETPQKQWLEDKNMQDFIQESKRKLVKKGILKVNVLDKKVQALHALAADNHDWRYLCAAQLFR